jgi:hypothetical protein
MYLSARAGHPNPNPTTAGAIALLPSVRPRDPLGEYRRGVRRDPNAFVSLKEDKQWDSWERSTVAQARAQDLSDVLDSTFVPATPKATELFVEKQKFVYAIFDKMTKANRLSGSMQALLMPRTSFVTSLCIPTPQPWLLG